MSKNLWPVALKMNVSNAERWAWYIKAQYGLTVAQHQKMVTKQGGKCALCGKKKKLNIDHDHKTGRVRELLCTHCNHKVVGTVEKNIALAERAIKYLKKWSKRK